MVPPRPTTAAIIQVRLSTGRPAEAVQGVVTAGSRAQNGLG
jgi:hypothetical protein